MNNKRTRLVIADCLKRMRALILIYLIMVILNSAVFIGYGQYPEPLIYAAVLTGAFLLMFLGIGIVRSLKAAQLREDIHNSLHTCSGFPTPETLADEDYQAMLTDLQTRLAKSETRSAVARGETEDILTAWVHQIKTPIAVMRMELADSDTREALLAREELFRIEQYADMMLQFIRLGSGSNDLVIREYALDDILRESIRKFAAQFIRRKLSVRYEGTDLKIVTDRKWFGCILDQLLSNAIKYTASGAVTVRVTDHCVSVTDTGFGIASEDLPRIFEKGYTGINGRLEKHSSGLGLYLARSAAIKLGLSLRAESKIGSGSCFTIDLADKVCIPPEN